MALELEELTERVIGCAITVHRTLGPGFLEAIYERALAVELRHNGLDAEYQRECSIVSRNEEVGLQRIDLLVEDCLVVELKAISALADIHFAQTRSYLKALKLKHGLLLNFATMPLTIKRVIHQVD